jgi:sialic acid synthase SpsE
MVSLGLARGRDIIQVGDIVEKHKVALTLMHCISKYPTDVNECYMKEGIGRINRLMGTGQLSRFTQIGYSDHTADEAAILAAIIHGATTIECHFDLGGHGDEFSYGHCWTKDRLQYCIQKMRRIEEAIGQDDDWGRFDNIENSKEYKWIADPTDGMRPLKKFR